MIIVDASEAVFPAWLLFRSRLFRIARRLTDDRDLRDDLLQEALIMLWEMDPTRFDLRNSKERGYLLRSMANRMRNVWRAEWLKSTTHEAVYPWLNDGETPREGRLGSQLRMLLSR